MSKSTTPLLESAGGRSGPPLVLSRDVATGEITRLTRFLPGADTAAFGGKAHDFPEEILIVSSRLFDGAVALWLEPGHYASRSPGRCMAPSER